MLRDALAKDLKHTHTQDLFSSMQHVFRQIVSRNMGYEVCQEVPLQYVNKGVLELRELLKREESSLPSSMQSLGRLAFDLSVTGEDHSTQHAAKLSPTSLLTLTS